jgi:aryl-alcohol dehydrogenase-like predicted oxidoreductase
MMQEFLPERERQERVVASLRKVSEQTGRSLAQVALAWLRFRDIPVIPIVGARKLAQFKDNLGSLSLALTPEQVKALNQASHVEPGFPYNLYQREIARNFVYGGMRDQILA